MPPLSFSDRQKERWALLQRPKEAVGDSLAIFVHGFLGDHLTTWGRLPELLRDHALDEPKLAAWDYLFFGYPTRNIETYLDMAELIATQWGNASQGRPPFGRAYTRLALFGHSLGTLGIRQLLCAEIKQPTGMLNALHSVTLFGTPLNGSGWANVGRLFGGPISEALKPANPQLRMLKLWNDGVRARVKWPKVRVVLGTDDAVVGNKYSDLIDFEGDASKQRYNLGHLNMVKPDDWTSSTVRDEVLGALT